MVFAGFRRDDAKFFGKRRHERHRFASGGLKQPVGQGVPQVVAGSRDRQVVRHWTQPHSGQ